MYVICFQCKLRETKGLNCTNTTSVGRNGAYDGQLQSGILLDAWGLYSWRKSVCPLVVETTQSRNRKHCKIA